MGRRCPLALVARCWFFEDSFGNVAVPGAGDRARARGVRAVSAAGPRGIAAMLRRTRQPGSDLGYLSGGNDGANGSSGWERASRAAARKSRATDLIAPSR